MDHRGDQILQKILAKDFLPSLSALTVRLVSMAADDQTRLDELTAVIEQSPGLTTRLLRLVNSAAYKHSDQEVTSVGRAVALLGLRQVRLMALSLSLRDTLPTRAGLLDYGLYWRASLHRAVLARRTAMVLGRRDTEEAFVAGLIQEVGLPLLLKAIDPEQAAAFPGLACTLEDQLAWERSHLGLDHRRVGREVMTRWGLPRVLVACQEPVDPDQDDPPSLAAVADFARRGTEAFFAPGVELSDIHRLALRRFGLDPDTVSQMLVDSLADAAEAAEALEVDLDHQADLLAVMEKANQAILRLNQSVEPYVQRIMRPDHDDLEAREQAVVNTLEAVVHEIRNPLMSVGGFARRLAAKMTQGGEVSRYAEAIVSEAARLDDVLAEMARLVTPPQPDLRPLELGQAVQEAAQGLAHDPPAHMPEAEVALQTNIEPGLWVLADRDLLAGALRDLLAYAAHLWDQAGRRGPMAIAARADGGHALVEISGRGVLPDEEQAPLAQLSFGPELNLVRARRIFSAHGAELRQSFNSQEKSFVFKIQIPREMNGNKLGESTIGNH